MAYDNQHSAMNCDVAVLEAGIVWVSLEGFRMELTSTTSTPITYWGEAGRPMQVNCDGQKFTSNQLAW